MKTLKGPAIFLAQFAGDEPPFNETAFDDFAGAGTDEAANRRTLGIE